MRRLIRLFLLAAVAAGLVKLARSLLGGQVGRLYGGETAPADSPRQDSQERGGSSRATEPNDTGKAGPRKAELYQRAKELGIEGRSKMSKSELQRAVEEHEGG